MFFWLKQPITINTSERKRGEEWLVTNLQAESYLPDANEEVFQVVKRVALNISQFCFVKDVVDKNGKNRLGARELRKGISSFFFSDQNVPERFTESLSS